jgi:hypothetical protein
MEYKGNLIQILLKTAALMSSNPLEKKDVWKLGFRISVGALRL